MHRRRPIGHLRHEILVSFLDQPLPIFCISIVYTTNVLHNTCKGLLLATHIILACFVILISKEKCA
jgi:hypothetical protein